MAAFPTYFTGTIAITAGATVVNLTGGSWNSPNAKPGDRLIVAGHEVRIADVPTTLTGTIDPWPFAAVPAGTSYIIEQSSPFRFVGSDAMASVIQMLGYLNSLGPIINVATGTLPDPSIGSDGMNAHRMVDDVWWLKAGGAWGLSPSPSGAPSLTGNNIFTGTNDFQNPNTTAITQALLNNSTRLATTAYVDRTTRKKLTADTTWYVRPDGNDLNTGNADTSGSAFLTPNRAVDVILKTIDCAGYIPTIKIADGTYTGGILVTGPALNCHNYGLFIIGNITTPSNVIISTSGLDAIAVTNGAHIRVGGMKVQTATSGNGLNAYFGSLIENTFTGTMVYGACANSQIAAGLFANIFLTSDYTINGSATSHWHSGAEGGNIVTGTITITITGTPAFSAYFCGVNKGSVTCGSTTFSGSATGKRFVCHYNGTIDASGQTRNFLPGNIAGTQDNGGVYIGSESDKYDPQSAWKPYTPAVSALGGTLTSVSAAGKYKLDGTICHIEAEITVTSVGSASGGFLVGVPIAPINNVPIFGSCPDTGGALMGYITTGSGLAPLFVVTGAFPASGQRVFMSGSFEVSPTA